MPRPLVRSVTSPPGRFRAWLVVGLLFLVVCSNFLTRYMLPTMRGSIVQSIPMTDAQFGLLSSCFLWVYGLASPFAGFLADRYSRSRVILCSLLAWSIITWLTSYATTFGQFLTMRMLMALSEVAYVPAGMALIADYHPGATRARATGLHQAGISAGAMLGGLGGWLAQWHSWRYAFATIGLASLGYGIVLVFFLRDAPRAGAVPTSGTTLVEPHARLSASLRSLFSSPSFILLLLTICFLGGSAWVILGWLPTFLAETFRLGQGAAGFSATGYLSAAGILGLIVAGIWSDRWSRRNERARVFVSVIGLTLAAPALLLAAMTSSLWLAIVGLMLCGFMRALSDANVMPILCLTVDPRYRATGYGLLNLASTFTGGVLIYAAGALRDHRVPLRQAIIGAAAAQLCCVALLLLIKPLRTRS